MTAIPNKRTRLRLFRSKNEQIRIGDTEDYILITVEQVYNDKTILVVEAPRTVRIDRVETLPGGKQ